MNNGNLQNSHNNIQAFNEVQNQSARLNAERVQQPSLYQKLKTYLQRKLSRKNIIKGVFLLIVIIGTLFIAGNFLQEMLVNQKTPPTISHSIFSQVNEVSAPNQVAYRAFYYYKKMVQMAKHNVKIKNSYKNGDATFKNLTFWELYSIFKVVKTIQLAKGYSSFSQDDDQTEQAVEDYSNIQNLTTPVNYREYFNTAADQGYCASCYSFPITATIQYMLTRKYKNLIKLSQQQLIDCSNPDQKANGCNDGNMTRGFQYSQKIGLVQQKNYPYRSQVGKSFPCNKDLIKNQSIIKFKISSFKQLPVGDCKAIQAQLAKGNVVATMMNAQKLNTLSDFNTSFRDCKRDKPNHAITIVGQTQKQEWIVRNSWGQGWGDHGYFKIGKGNTCGVCNYGVVPILDSQDIPKDDK